MNTPRFPIDSFPAPTPAAAAQGDEPCNLVSSARGYTLLEPTNLTEARNGASTQSLGLSTFPASSAPALAGSFHDRDARAPSQADWLEAERLAQICRDFLALRADGGYSAR